MLRRIRHGGRVIALLLLGSYSLWWSVFLVQEARDWQGSDRWQVTRSLSLESTDGGQVRYTYAVDGWPFHSSRSHFFYAGTYLDPRPGRWLDRNRGLTAVAVFYDPQAPERAVLVRRLDSPWRLLPGLLLMSLLPLLLSVVGWRWWRRRKSLEPQNIVDESG